MSGLTDRLRTAAAGDTSPRDGDGAQPALLRTAATVFAVVTIATLLEAITDAAKNADPTQVTVTLTETDGPLTFEVTDDGADFDPDTRARGHGLTDMTDRLDALGGQLQIRAAHGARTTLAGSLPVTAREAVAT